MTTTQIKNAIYGIEIECCFNHNIHPNVVVGEYSHGEKITGIPGWITKRDGSLYNHAGWKDCEFVSQKCMSKKILFKVLDDFKTFMSKKYSKAQKHEEPYELKEVLKFNQSTGAHIHFSVKDFKFGEKTTYDIYPKVTKFFLERLKTSKIKSKGVIESRYFRSYAAKFTKAHMNASDRRCEWNFISERSGKGLEWRSPNFTDIETWDELYEMVGIMCDTLEHLYKLSIKWKAARQLIVKESELRSKWLTRDFLARVRIEKQVYTTHRLPPIENVNWTPLDERTVEAQEYV